jgi:predicted Zn-dependent peptidase
VWASYGAEREYGRTVAYAGTTPERAQETLDVTLNELRRIGRADGKITEEELERARIGMKSRLVFSGESSSARATALAHDVRKLGRARSLDEMAARIDGVELGALNAYLAGRELGRVTVATIGPKELRFSD